jgi:ribose 5-phosphate isomerase
LNDDLKRLAAAAALAEIEPGQRLGLGTGSTAKLFVDLLGERVKAGFACICVPTSEVTAAQAEALGIPLTTLEETPELDLTIDGADEIGPGLALIKGAGAVTLRLGKAGEPVVTDGGHLLLDALFGRISKPEALSADLHQVPGVVEHGLFLGLCSKAYVAGPNGVETIDA